MWMSHRCVYTILALLTLVLAAACDEIEDQYREDRGVVKVLRDGEWRIIEEEF